VHAEACLFSCDLLKALLLINNAGTELISEAYAEGGLRLPHLLGLLQS